MSRETTRLAPEEARSRKDKGGGCRSLAAMLPKVTNRALGKRGFSEGALITRWTEIVGERLAQRCRPRGVSYANRRQRRDGTLLLRVASGFATELQHLEPQIIERINGFLGYQGIIRLKFQQGPLPVNRPLPEVQKPSLDPESEAVLVEKLADVEDSALRSALLGLGQSLGQRNK